MPGRHAVMALLSMNSEDSIRIQREQHVQLNFYTFDCLWYDGEWLLDKPLKERRKYLIQAIQELREAGFRAGLPKSSLKDKKGLYNQIIENGGEGIILKNLESPYHPFTTRSHRNWVKVKRSMSETLKNAGFDYTDAFITGYELASEDKANAGYVGTLIFSVYLLDKNGEIKGLHEIAKISGLTQEMREEITDFIDGEPKLKEEYYGQVWEIDGQAISARSKRFRHAVLVRPRPDRSSDTCQMSEELLNSMVF